MTVTVADEEKDKLAVLGKIASQQWWDLIRRIKEGGLDAARACQGLQAVIENRWDRREDLPYANERVPSNLGYPEGFRFRTPAEQLGYWKSQKLTSKLDGQHVIDLTKRIEDAGLPAGAESIGVVPKFSRLGGLYRATEQVFDLIAGSCDFQNWRGNEIVKKEYWRHTIKTAGFFQRLDEYQPGDFFVFPFQFGKFWAGASIRHGRVRFSEWEFGLCPYSSGCLLLPHPDRITGDGQLRADLLGCEWSPYAVGDFFSSAFFCWFDGRLCFDFRSIGYADPGYGSVTAFAPQC